MADKEELGGFLGGVAGGAIGGAIVGAVLIKKHLRDGEDRPVIVVSGGSLNFDHEKKWKRKHPSSKRQWETAHANGKTLTVYVVKITNPASPLRYAADGVIVTFGTGTTFTFSREEENSAKDVPLLESTEDVDFELTPHGPNEKRLVFDGNGVITKLELDGQLISPTPAAFEIWMF